AAPQRQQGAVHGEVVGVGGEAALLGEGQAVGDATFQLVEPVGAVAELGRVRVGARRDLVEAVLQPGAQAVVEHRDAGVVVEVGGGGAGGGSGGGPPGPAGGGAG